MEEAKRKEHIADFGKHVPKLLQLQLLSEQSIRYVKTRPNDPTSMQLLPSIQRFHGSILFVDISGFTVLSQKLDVESLKNYINGYFSNIIEIVEKWGGDVIKFAGDALYVVWQTNTGRSGTGGENDKAGGTSRPAKSMRSMSMMPTFINQEFRQNATEATKKAVSCGLEICEVCGNYPVYMEGKSNPGTDRGAGMFSSIVSSITTKIISRSLASDSQQPIAHLDVHCGVSVGLMAGLDVGYEDRWEYFLVGDALGDVARAEGQAEKGDVVISGAAHELYHVAAHAARVALINEVENNGDDQEEDPFEAEFEVLSCGCVVLTGNCFKLKGSGSSSNGMAPNSKQGQNRKTQLQARAKSPTNVDIKKENSKLYEGFASEVKSALMLISPMLKREYATYVLQLAQDNNENDPTNGESSDAIIERVKQLDKLLPTFIHSKVRRHLAQWLEQSMVDHLARHVHDVAREGYTISTTTQLEPFRLLLENFLSSLDKKGLGLPIDIGGFKDTVRKPFSNRALVGQQHSLSSVSVGETDDASELDEHFDGRMTIKDASKSIHGKTFHQSAVDAEMRNVTVMFIKIDAFDMSLLIDASQSRDSRKGNQRFDTAFGFLERTENEQMADKLIIDKLQCCLEALTRAIYSHGGHMRQFIVDDKGTVCIASFGLRGAVNDDNAANAMDAANMIIRDLDKQHLHASIGITTGKAYCGLVGSIRRHEYAIMGPSVNLSARLMSKAGPGAILCDQETKNSDRAHTFRHRGEIVAKGYTQPVSTYSPSFGDSMDMDLHRNAFDDSTYPYMHGDNSLADGDESVVSGRSNSERGRGKQRSSALRFSIAVDAPQMHDIRSKSLKELASRERLLNMIESEFFFTDEITGGRALDNAMIANGVDKSGKFAGFRTLRGRESEIERILKFLFEENGSDGFLMTSYEAPSRMVVVLGSGGAGKTALFSAIGQKLFTTAKTDAGCNVVVLSNRMSQLIASARQNPFRPILIELVRLIKKAFEVRSPPTGDSSTASGQAHRQHGQQQQSVRKVRSQKRMLIKEDSIREYNLVIDTLFEQLRTELSPLKVILTDLMGITSPTAAGSPNRATAGNESSAMVQDEKAEQFKTLLVEVLNFYAAYTKKVLLIILEDVNTIEKTSSDVLKHVWENGKGVHFLLSSSSAPTMGGGPGGLSTKAKSSTNSSRSPPPMLRSISKMASMRNINVFITLEDSPRFLKLELQPLTKDASIMIAEDIVGDEFPPPLKKAISASGGNPLYIVQMASSMIIEGTGPIAAAMESAVAHVNKLDDNGGTLTASSTAAANTTPADTATIIPNIIHQSIADLNGMANMKRRVEEIICFRLDQLDGFTQMVLKAATVAAANGKTFSAKLIAFMINGNSKMLLKLSASFFPHLLQQQQQQQASTSNLPEELVALSLQPPPGGTRSPTVGASSSTPKSGGNPMRINLHTRERMVTQVLQTLLNNGDFLQLKGEGDGSGKLPSSIHEVDGVIVLTGAEEFEFQIAMEQSTIYSLIVDEQREYFHGKVAQFYFQRWMHADPATYVECALREFLVMAYHAEQAALWPLALRAFLQSSVFESIMGKTREFMASILECYKVYRCFEQESGTSVTPFPLAQAMNDQEVIVRVLCTSTLPEPELADLAKRFESELDCVYDVFGLDRASLVYAVRVHLFLADFYLAGFHDVSLAEQMLGTALKLMFAVRLCADFHDGETTGGGGGIGGGLDLHDDDVIHLTSASHKTPCTPSPTTVVISGMQGSSLGSSSTDSLPAHEAAHEWELSTTLEETDVCHFFNAYFVLTQTIPVPVPSTASQPESPRTPSVPVFTPTPENKAVDMVFPWPNLQSLYVKTQSMAQWTAMQTILAVRRQAYDEAIGQWQSMSIPTTTNEVRHQHLRVGMDLCLWSHSLLLQALVASQGSATAVAEKDTTIPTAAGSSSSTIIDELIARIGLWIDLHDASLAIFHVVTPAVAPLALLGRWKTLLGWFKAFGRASRTTHDVLGAQNALYKHLYRWIRALYHVSLQMNYSALLVAEASHGPSTTAVSSSAFPHATASAAASSLSSASQPLDSTAVAMPTLIELKHSLDYFSSQGGTLKTRCSGSKALEQFMKMIQPTLAMQLRHVGLVPEVMCLQLLIVAYLLNRERIVHDGAAVAEFETRYTQQFQQLYDAVSAVAGTVPASSEQTTKATADLGKSPFLATLVVSSAVSLAYLVTTMTPIMQSYGKMAKAPASIDTLLQETLFPTDGIGQFGALLRQIANTLGHVSLLPHPQLRRILLCSSDE